MTLTGATANAPSGRADGQDGAFKRQDSMFRHWVSEDGTSGFPLVRGRYHLYVARACPWAHRTIIARKLMGLGGAVSMSFVDPIRDERGWAFTGDGRYEDPVNGFSRLAQAYAAGDAGYQERVSVPVLWDRERSTIVNNESADIMRMLTTVFAPLADHPVELYAGEIGPEIDELNERVYSNVNDAVYKAGFARHQEVYEREVGQLFAMLDELDARLSRDRYLFGPVPVETDWRLFTTLIRFDAVYHIHFKCSVRKIVEYQHLWPYLRDLYQHPGIAETVCFAEIRAHYYGSHAMINPTGRVALMPALDLSAAPGRDQRE